MKNTEIIRSGINVPAAELIKIINFSFGRIKKKYRNIRENPENEIGNWVEDNYFVIERESKIAKKELRKIGNVSAVGKGRAPIVYEKLKECLGSGEEVTEEATEDAIKKADSELRLRIKEFDFAPSALRCVLVEEIGSGIENGNLRQVAEGIKGLTRLRSIDFVKITEKISEAEKLLAEDPMRVYEIMDEESKAYYRYMVERISKKEGTEERDVIKKAMEDSLCESGSKRHIGYSLKKLYDESVMSKLRKIGTAALIFNFAAGAALSVVFGVIFGDISAPFFLILPFWEIVRTLTSRVLAKRSEVDVTVRLDEEKADIKDGRCIAVVSCIIPEGKGLEKIIENTEKMYFANTDIKLDFCILADFGESDVAEEENDGEKIAGLEQSIAKLNLKTNGGFMFAVRKRRFCKTQDKYCGWERKRGAITEFIRYIKTGDTGGFCKIGGDLSWRESDQSKKYIIALDSDTNLLFKTAGKLIRAAMHPLNKAIIDKKYGIVTEGYGILVPRVSTELTSANRTAFSKATSDLSQSGQYDGRTKEFYQDFFGETIFSGKGIIDIDAYYELLDSGMPEEKILSHDIIEGAVLRAGFVSDVELSDECPPDAFRWLKREHRWIRGDIQNAVFLKSSFRQGNGNKKKKNGINLLSKYKLLDNIRRAVNPVAISTAIFYGAFAVNAESTIEANAIVIIAAAAQLLEPVISFVCGLVFGGWFLAVRRRFTNSAPILFKNISAAFYGFVMLLQRAVNSTDAIVKAIYRMAISGKKRLEWVCASDLSGGENWEKFKEFLIGELLGTLLVFSACRAAKMCGVFFLLALPAAYFSAAVKEKKRKKISEKDRRRIKESCRRMWSFYEDYAVAEDNYLPPDNVQTAPVYTVAHRTSPTDIGFSVLSAVAARDFGFIDSEGLFVRISRTVDTVLKLEKYCGHLYNWYDTRNLSVLSPRFVSAVDSGNMISAFVAVKEGLKEYEKEEPRLRRTIVKIEKIIGEADFSVFYDRKSRLFSIGIDAQTGNKSDSRYDFLMSEARLTSYYAVAVGQIPKNHWNALSRMMSRKGLYAGMVSWSGTMFEYFMPHILLPVYENSNIDETLRYCLYCQKRSVKNKNIPWGISESAYYGFDGNLAYQYKAHGIKKLGVRKRTEDERVVSPYSSYLALPYCFKEAMKNLEFLEKEGLYSKYGFFEAVSYEKQNEKNNKKIKTEKKICRSYMAHHVGMSITSAANALYGGIMQKRFMADDRVGGAKELLKEGAERDEVIYDGRKFRETGKEKKEDGIILSGIVEYDRPNTTLISNGELSDVLSDTGENALMYSQISVNRKSDDAIQYPHGIYVFADEGGNFESFTPAPFYDSDIEYKAEMGLDGIKYFYKSKKTGFDGSVDCKIHQTLPVERREITVKNGSAENKSADIIIYFEPILSREADYSAHPVFSKLFVKAGYDEKAKCVTFERRARDEKEKATCTVGFLENVEYEYETEREKIFSSAQGYASLRNIGERRFCGCCGVPDVCLAIRVKIELMPLQKVKLNLLISAARDREESVGAIEKYRNIDRRKLKYASSPFGIGRIENTVAQKLLTRMVYPIRDAASESARRKNNLSLRDLWGLSISGDHPIVVYEAIKACEPENFKIYLKLMKIFQENGMRFDIVAVYDGQKYPEFLKTAYRVINEAGCEAERKEKRGIYFADKNCIDEERINLIYSASILTVSEESEKIDNFRSFYLPAKINKAVPGRRLPDGLKSCGGVFADGRFYVEKKSAAPYCNILAGRAMGTVLSDRFPGFTWSVNSRENKLTPWVNDFACGQWGERVIVKISGKMYDLTDGALCSFSENDAIYESRIGDISAKVRITVAKTGCAKYCDIEIKNDSAEKKKMRVAYYIEPVLGNGRKESKYIKSTKTDNAILLFNPANFQVRRFVALGADTRDVKFVCSRADFLSGRWSEEIFAPQPDCCAAAICDIEILQNGSSDIKFTISCGASEAGALKMMKTTAAEGEKVGKIKIKTPDKYLNEYINNWCMSQIVKCRLWGRTSFYQNGGAYGFRDQLQDACAVSAVMPQETKRQILRAASVQFKEGDVMHWWHSLPKGEGGIKGVRTRYSDDLLWLPYAVCVYVETTGDKGILDISTPYIFGETLSDGERERYFESFETDLKESVYEHCIRAFDKVQKFGEHGMPLIGGGDWNDGFNNVGYGGKGESVWLAMFLKLTADKFVRLCREKGDERYAEKLEKISENMEKAVDENGWDGEWYLRAFYDDGTAIGSKNNGECSEDLLVQSFAVLSGIGDKNGRGKIAVDSAYKNLVDQKNKLVKLFSGAFGEGDQNPGYIKVYPKGIRENGGQYTHAAIWFAMALIRKGMFDKGYEILDMLDPASRCSDRELGARYGLEPYSIAADIYSNEYCVGRGGWSWYTGSAGWYYTAVIREMLGIKRKGDRVYVEPCLPSGWNGYEAELELISSNGKTVDIKLRVRRGKNGKKLRINGKDGEYIELCEEKIDAEVEF